jgi:hypothetical protein
MRKKKGQEPKGEPFDIAQTMWKLMFFTDVEKSIFPCQELNKLLLVLLIGDETWKKLMTSKILLLGY